MDIIAEWISENEKGKKYSALTIYAQCHHLLLAQQQSRGSGWTYTNYYDFANRCAHALTPLSCNAAREDAGISKVTVSIDDEEMIERLGRFLSDQERRTNARHWSALQ